MQLHHRDQFHVNLTTRGILHYLWRHVRFEYCGCCRGSRYVNFQDGERQPCCVSCTVVLDHPWRVIDGMNFVMKFGPIECMVSEILLFIDFGNGLKMPIDALLVGFGGTFPSNDVIHRPTPKRTVIGLNHVISALRREYRPYSSSWTLEREKRQYRTGQKSHKGVIFNIFGEKPPIKRSTSKIM